MEYSTLQQILNNSVSEVKFNRKRPKPGVAATRRMLCTLDVRLLESELGKQVLNYKPATGTLKYDPSTRGLLCVWDIFVQDWRMINTETCSIVTSINTGEDAAEFWSYFNTVILPMSSAAKAAFINA